MFKNQVSKYKKGIGQLVFPDGENPAHDLKPQPRHAELEYAH